MAHLIVDGFRGPRDKEFFLKLNNACREFLAQCLRRFGREANIVAINFGGRTSVPAKGKPVRILARIHFEELTHVSDGNRAAIAKNFETLMRRYAPGAVVSSIVSFEK